MNTRMSALMAGVSRFAHLATFGKPKAAKSKAEDDEDKKKKDEESARAEDDDGDDDRMEDGDDNDTSAEGNDDDAGEDDGDEDKKKKNKKAKKAASSDDDERCEDDEDKKEARAAGIREGRRMERERIARVLSSQHAAKNIDLAVSLACETGLSSKAIIATLQKTASTVRSTNRSANNPRIDAGGGEPAPKGAQIAQSWDRAFVKVGITPRAA